MELMMLNGYRLQDAQDGVNDAKESGHDAQNGSHFCKTRRHFYFVAFCVIQSRDFSGDLSLGVEEGDDGSECGVGGQGSNGDLDFFGGGSEFS
ncbi:hypothetical protein NL676_034679 [Syzygium grande]|nr:hypothetical protein NL676_034679 [Syzygium grande]